MTSVDALKNLPVPLQVQNAPAVKLKDIATVEKVKAENTITRVNGKEALAFVLFKESDASAVTAGEEVKDTVDKINKDYDGVEATTLFTTGDMVKNSVNSMVREVALGAFSQRLSFFCS